MRLYYVQDDRGVVGNCALWWAKNDAGYTCDLDAAAVYTEEEVGRRNWRETDVPRDKDVIDAMVIRHVRRDNLRDRDHELLPPPAAGTRCPRCHKRAPKPHGCALCNPAALERRGVAPLRDLDPVAT